MKRKTIVITMGDPRGIGPEVVCKALDQGRVTRRAHFCVIGVPQAFQKFSRFKNILHQENVEFVAVPIKGSAGAQALAAIDQGIALMREGRVQALVTGPVCKESISQIGVSFTGHTSYLCQAFGVKKHAMMLFHDRLRVVLSTVHIPLRKVAGSLDQKSIQEKLGLVTQALKKCFKISHPHIAVCGLNPHAGEGGLMGEEEKTIIAPAIRKFLRGQKPGSIIVSGPLSPDTVFYQALSGAYDAVLCHYHDQGLIPLKTTGFDTGVNLTLGLPFVRTSPDHGTAFDIAGKGLANPQSMIAAIEAAIKFS